MTDLPKEWIAKLNVDAESLCAGLKLIKKFTGLGRRSVPLAYSDCQLEVEFGDYVFYVDAEGDWNGSCQARRS